MPIYEIQCRDCRYTGEVLVITPSESPLCPGCGSARTEKLMSATSSLTGKSGSSLSDSHMGSCCGGQPSTAGCAGPGSCCGHSH